LAHCIVRSIALLASNGIARCKHHLAGCAARSLHLPVIARIILHGAATRRIARHQAASVHLVHTVHHHSHATRRISWLIQQLSVGSYQLVQLTDWDGSGILDDSVGLFSSVQSGFSTHCAAARVGTPPLYALLRASRCARIGRIFAVGGERGRR